MNVRVRYGVGCLTATGDGLLKHVPLSPLGDMNQPQS